MVSDDIIWGGVCREDYVWRGVGFENWNWIWIWKMNYLSVDHSYDGKRYFTSIMRTTVV